MAIGAVGKKESTPSELQLMKEQLHYVFMYGSNLLKSRLQARVQNWNGRYQRGILSGYELRFNKRSQLQVVAANVMPRSTHQVWGILVELDADDLEQMDIYEGYPNHYNRVQLPIRLEDTGEVMAYVYVANPTKILEGHSPRREYLNYVLQGALSCGLPLNYIRRVERLGEGGTEESEAA